MDIYALLSGDHRRVLALFSRLEAEESPAETERDRLFHELQAELSIHREAEERIFYAALAGFPGTGDLIDESIEEHLDLAELIEDLRDFDGDETEFLNLLAELREEFQHHIEFEEEEVFNTARRLLTDEDAGKLAEEMQRERNRLTA